MTDNTSRRTILRATGATLAASAFAGCIGALTDGENAPAGAGSGVDPTVVEVGPDEEFVFSPGTDEPLRVASGETVRFAWRSDNHNVVVESRPDGADWQGHEPIENEGFSFEHTFDVPGRYEYVCEPHEALGMTGVVVVTEE